MPWFADVCGLCPLTAETEKLIDWALRTFMTIKPDWSHAIPATIPVYEGMLDSVAIAPAGSSYVTLGRGEEKRVSISYQPAPALKHLIAPVAQGASVGDLEVMVDGKPEAKLPVVTQSTVARAGFFKRLRDRIRLAL